MIWNALAPFAFPFLFPFFFGIVQIYIYLHDRSLAHFILLILIFKLLVG
jgi:hypothetical protein